MNLSFIDTDMREERYGEDVGQPPQHALIWPNLNSTKHNPTWKANSSSACQEIPRTLWNPKVQYHFHKSSLLAPFLSQINPIHAPILFLESPVICYPPICVCVFQVLSFPQFSPPTSCKHVSFPHTCHTSCPSHYSWFYHPNSVCSGVPSWTCSLCSLLHSPVTSSLLGPNIFLSTLFPNTLSVVPPAIWRTSFTPIHNNRQNNSSVYLNLDIFL